MLSHKIYNIKQSHILYSTYTRYNLLFKYNVWYLCTEECVFPSSTYSPLPWYTDFWLHIIPGIQKLSTTLGVSTYFQVPGQSYKESSRPHISGDTVQNWVTQDSCMPDLYYYCSLISFLYYHSLLQFFYSIFPKYRFSFCNLQDSHHLRIHKSWLTSNNPCIICRYYYLSLSITLHNPGSHGSLVIAIKTKPKKILLYIPQNTV